MIIQSHCKINLGLQILKKRDDGFHDLSTIMYPIVGKPDIVELLWSSRNSFTSSGIIVDCEDDKNLCMKALRLMQSRYDIGFAKVLLHKQIPFGAGLGGGSANAVAVLKLVNREFQLNLSDDILCNLAAELGSDTPFFVTQKPALASSRGEILNPIDVDLSQYYIYIVKPPIAISTAMAYGGVTAKHSKINLLEAVKQPIEQWKNLIVNDFEDSLFQKFEELKKIKQKFYDAGALYSSMSGSGSAMFGVFDKSIGKQLESSAADTFEHLWHIEKSI